MIISLVQLCQFRFLRIKLLYFGLALLACGSLWSCSVAQGQSLPVPTDLLPAQPSIMQVENLEVGDVYLDGRSIFSVTAPRVESTQNRQMLRSPLQTRVKDIQAQLKAIAVSSLEQPQFEAEITLDPDSRVVEINQQYLMTLTPQDVQAFGADLNAHFISIRQSLTRALETFYRERQPQYLQQQLGQALWLGVGALLLVLAERFIQKRICRQRTQAIANIKLDEIARPDLSETLSEAEQHEVMEADCEFKRRRDQLSRINFKYDLQSTGIKLLYFAALIGAIAYLLSRFPQTRWIQSLVFVSVLTTVLKLLGCVAGTFLLLRLSLLGIDYGFELLRAGQRFTLQRTVRRLLRLQTLRNYVKSVIVALFSTAGLLISLSVLGLDLAPVLAGAGILGIAISFGAQTFVKDVINGLFLLWEDQFGVGDVVTINAVTGLVESMNLRMTQLRSPDGDLISIPNGSIDMVSNHSNKWSRANLGIRVAYGTDVDQAIALIREVATRMYFDPDWREQIIEQPQVLGVDDFGDNSITIRIWITTQPLKQWDVSREYRRRLKIAFDHAGISIPFPQRSLWFENTLNHLNPGSKNPNMSDDALQTSKVNQPKH